MNPSASLAERTCVAKGWSFRDTFRFHFRFSRVENEPCKEWRDARIGGWFLHHCPDLPRHEVYLADGRFCGVVLGVAVDADGMALEGAVHLASCDTLTAVVSYLEGLAGRFIALIALDGVVRIYFDPTAGLSAVYSARDQAVASCVHLLINRDLKPEPAVRSEDVMQRKSQFMFGETCDADCKRVMANHYLDLETFQLVRHWPKDDFSFQRDTFDRNSAALIISQRLTQILGALANSYSVALPISAGTDSRILLAAARPHLDRIDSFFVHDIYTVTQFDREGAQLLADELGLELQVIDRRTPIFTEFLNDAEIGSIRDRMAIGTSLSFNGIDDLTVTAACLAPSSDLVLRGNAAEMSRANKWTPQTVRNPVSDRDGVAALLNVRENQLEDTVEPSRLDELLRGYAAWREKVPQGACDRLPDLAHIELFMPAGPNNVYYAFTRNFYINPYNDRQILLQTAWFHPLARRRKKLVAKIIANTTPKLDKLPYIRELKQRFKDAKKKGVA